MFSFIDLTTIAEKLRHYELPNTILPAVADRTPFRGYSVEALRRAVRFVEDYPECRGITARCIRTLMGVESPPDAADLVTMEAHLDATALPPHLADEALGLGFGIDPFAAFNPQHYSDHFTMKFKVPAAATDRRKNLATHIFAQCERLYTALGQAPASIEAYIELEVYRNSQNRRDFAVPLGEEWQASFPLRAGDLHNRTPPRDDREAELTGLSLGAFKEADIHIKINAKDEDRAELIATLKASGFYHVRTGSNNDVLTAQFFRMRDAKYVFDVLALFFAIHGGCTELTLEPLRHLWRTEIVSADRRLLARLPPLVVSVARQEDLRNSNETPNDLAPWRQNEA